MLTILCSSQTGVQARQMFDKKPADMGVDIVLGDHLLDRAAADIGFRLVVADESARPAGP